MPRWCARFRVLHYFSRHYSSTPPYLSFTSVSWVWEPWGQDWPGFASWGWNGNNVEWPAERIHGISPECFRTTSEVRQLPSPPPVMCVYVWPKPFETARLQPHPFHFRIIPIRRHFQMVSGIHLELKKTTTTRPSVQLFRLGSVWYNQPGWCHLSH